MRAACGIAGAVIFGLLVNEMSALCPWAAHRLVRWAANRWSSDPEVAAAYADEWAAVIDERPGKLFKLLTALGFAGGAVGRAAPRHFTKIRYAVKQHPPTLAFARRLREMAASPKYRWLGFASVLTIPLAIAMLAGPPWLADAASTAASIMGLIMGGLASLEARRLHRAAKEMDDAVTLAEDRVAKMRRPL
jgi:hypothetical protein